MEYKLMFWNPGFAPKDENAFGCATLGFFDGNKWVEPDEKESVIWRSVKGIAYAGTYDELLERCRKTTVEPKSIFVFFSRDEGNDLCVNAIQDLFPKVPILGGTAAKTDDQIRGEIRPSGDNGAILLCEEQFEIEVKRVHNHDLKTVSCEVEEHRIIKTIDGEPASEYLKNKRCELGKPENDFETLTFHESCGKNVHCCEYSDGAVYAGANLEETQIMLSEISRDNVDEVISSFMKEDGGLSIGCAGLKSTLTRPFKGAEDNVGVFLFGEVMPFDDGRSRFTNLMMARVNNL